MSAEQVQEIQNLKAEIERLKTAPLSEYCQYLIKAIDNVLPIVGFAMANCPPLATAGWPVDNLDKFLELIEKVVAVDKRYRDVILDWQLFAGEARVCEADRVKKKKARGPRAKPASAEQLKKMAQDYDKEFGAGSIAKRKAEILGGKLS